MVSAFVFISVYSFWRGHKLYLLFFYHAFFELELGMQAGMHLCAYMHALGHTKARECRHTCTNV